jgi:hypothetical protein
MTANTTKSVYFTHDSNMLSDVKILRLRKKQGLLGYAISCSLLERLSASNNYKIGIDNIDDLSFDLRVDATLIEDVIYNYQLFEIEDGFFYSPSHRLKMQYKDEKSEKKRQAALARLAKTSPEELSVQNRKAGIASGEARAKKKLGETKNIEQVHDIMMYHRELTAPYEKIHGNQNNKLKNINEFKNE